MQEEVVKKENGRGIVLPLKVFQIREMGLTISQSASDIILSPSAWL
jgi:hypothetical protein